MKVHSKKSKRLFCILLTFVTDFYASKSGSHFPSLFKTFSDQNRQYQWILSWKSSCRAGWKSFRLKFKHRKAFKKLLKFLKGCNVNPHYKLTSSDRDFSYRSLKQHTEELRCINSVEKSKYPRISLKATILLSRSNWFECEAHRLEREIMNSLKMLFLFLRIQIELRLFLLNNSQLTQFP